MQSHTAVPCILIPPLFSNNFILPHSRPTWNSIWIEFLQVPSPVLGLGLGVDFTFIWANKNKKSPHQNLLKGTVLEDKKQGVGIRVKG